MASAVADRDDIYYSAYGDNTTGWMLEQFDTRTRFSSPLLHKESPTPLIVLGSASNWLVWLQLDERKLAAGQHALGQESGYTRTWSLHALYLGKTQDTSTGQAVLLQQDTFDQ